MIIIHKGLTFLKDPEAIVRRPNMMKIRKVGREMGTEASLKNCVFSEVGVSEVPHYTLCSGLPVMRKHPRPTPCHVAE